MCNYHRISSCLLIKEQGTQVSSIEATTFANYEIYIHIFIYITINSLAVMKKELYGGTLPTISQTLWESLKHIKITNQEYNHHLQYFAHIIKKLRIEKYILLRFLLFLPLSSIFPFLQLLLAFLP